MRNNESREETEERLREIVTQGCRDKEILSTSDRSRHMFLIAQGTVAGIYRVIAAGKPFFLYQCVVLFYPAEARGRFSGECKDYVFMAVELLAAFGILPQQWGCYNLLVEGLGNGWLAPGMEAGFGLPLAAVGMSEVIPPQAMVLLRKPNRPEKSRQFLPSN